MRRLRDWRPTNGSKTGSPDRCGFVLATSRIVGLTTSLCVIRLVTLFRGTRLALSVERRRGMRRADDAVRREHRFEGFDAYASTSPVLDDTAVFYTSTESAGVVAPGNLPPANGE